MFGTEFDAGNGAVRLPAGGGFAAPAWRLSPHGDPRWSNAGRTHRTAGWGLGIGSDLATDLGDDIGSGRWWLGMVTCTLLCGTALWLAVQVLPLPQPVRPGLTPTQRELARIETIAPLALGATTGAPALPDVRLVEPLAEAPERPRIELTATLNGRDSFESALRRAGVGNDDLAEVTRMLRPLANLGGLPRGTDMDLVLGRRESKAVPRPLEHLAFRSAFDMRLAVDRSDAGLSVKRLPIAVDSTPLRVKGLVGNSVQQSLRAAGIPGNDVAAYVKAMGYVVDFQHGVGKRDGFDIVIEQDKAETGDVRHGDLLFAAITPVGKQPIELGRYVYGKTAQYFRADGESAKKGLMRTPVDGARLTSGFGMRFHPLLAYSRMHQGVDFGAPSGSPIFAAAAGTVAFAARHGGHGNYVLLKHNKELNTGYAHMSRFAVRPGQAVSQGQVIGYVGSTGLSTGPHLHYEVWLRGKPINPVQLKFLGGTQLAGNDLAQFWAHMNRMRALKASGTDVAAATTRRPRGRPEKT